MADSSRYIELRAHTAFSFGDGAVAPEALIARAAELGYSALGITDNADLGALARASLTAREQNIQLIAGAELIVDGAPLAFLARTREGCRNLASLVTHARTGGLEGWVRTAPRRSRGHAHVSWADIEQASSGLHLLTGPASSKLSALVKAGQRDEALRMLHSAREVFNGHIAVEVQCHRVSGDESALAATLIELAKCAEVPWVVTNDSRYIDRGTRLVHDMLTALRAGVDLDRAAARGLLLPNSEWRLHRPEEIALRWEGCEAGLDESLRIAGECTFDVRWLRAPLPAFPAPNGIDPQAFLREQAYVGAHERWGDSLSDAQCKQLDHELGVIDRLGFAGFFLVMWDAVREARRLGILCQGRGSAANSAVAYCLGVTAVDPVRHGLLFERFLSEARIPEPSGDFTEAPDIDIDIEHERREQLLDYVYGRYERKHAAITCVVQMYRAPNAVLDAMRALGFPALLAQQISKRVHHLEPAEGAEALKAGLAAKFGVDLAQPLGKTLLAAMKAMDGLPRMRSTHVGGFVLSAEPLGNYLPIEHTAMGRTIIQFDKDDLDIIGVPKFDFLGLGALSLVRHAFDSIEIRTGSRPTLYGLPQDDTETYAMISRGDTLGTFQIESRAQIASILTTHPECLYDIVVQVALIRPGPIQGNFVHPYTRRRREQETVQYAHPLLEPILARTCGIPIFQEQAMALSMALGGFTAAEADKLRRTMGNMRKKGRLEAVLAELSTRMVENPLPDPPVSRECAEQISRELLTFSNYGFPESHAWSFALIAYATAYLKRHYPTEFYLGLLNAQPMGFYPVSTLIHDARRGGVEVRPPCLAQGDRYCTTEPSEDADQPALRIGWRHIRGVGERTLDRLSAVHTVASFDSINDVVQRVLLTRAEALQLARANAFAAWQPDRRKAAWEALRAVGDILPFAPARQVPYTPRSLDERELIFADYAATGICVTGHPMEHLRAKLRDAGVWSSVDLEQGRDGARILVAGLVTVRQRPSTAKGTVFLLLEDEWGFINIIVHRMTVEKYAEVVKYAPAIVVDGTSQCVDGVRNVIGRRFRSLEVASLAHVSRDFH